MSVFSHLYCSTTITFASQNSADLDMGRRPELKSAELCDANVTVIEITSFFCLKPLKQVVQLLAARPMLYRYLVSNARAWGTRFPPKNRPACKYLATSSSSARRRWHSLHSHRSTVRRRRDLRPEISIPCMDRPSCAAALARRAALRDHHTMRQKNACSTRLPCLPAVTGRS